MLYVVDPEGKQSDTLYDIGIFDGKRVLEIGCGDGHLTWVYAGVARHTTAIDPSEEKIALAQQGTPGHLSERVEFLVSSIQDFAPPHIDRKFDITIFGWSL
jgi:cyclopropane fatty-acyl-phospholipid synthase-like methyltransferase